MSKWLVVFDDATSVEVDADTEDAATYAGMKKWYFDGGVDAIEDRWGLAYAYTDEGFEQAQEQDCFQVYYVCKIAGKG